MKYTDEAGWGGVPGKRDNFRVVFLNYSLYKVVVRIFDLTAGQVASV